MINYNVEGFLIYFLEPYLFYNNNLKNIIYNLSKIILKIWLKRNYINISKKILQIVILAFILMDFLFVI